MALDIKAWRQVPEALKQDYQKKAVELFTETLAISKDRTKQARLIGAKIGLSAPLVMFLLQRKEESNNGSLLDQHTQVGETRFRKLSAAKRDEIRKLVESEYKENFDKMTMGEIMYYVARKHNMTPSLVRMISPNLFYLRTEAKRGRVQRAG